MFYRDGSRVALRYRQAWRVNSNQAFVNILFNRLSIAVVHVLGTATSQKLYGL